MCKKFSEGDGQESDLVDHKIGPYILLESNTKNCVWEGEFNEVTSFDPNNSVGI